MRRRTARSSPELASADPPARIDDNRAETTPIYWRCEHCDIGGVLIIESEWDGPFDLLLRIEWAHRTARENRQPGSGPFCDGRYRISLGSRTEYKFAPREEVPE